MPVRRRAVIPMAGFAAMFPFAAILAANIPHGFAYLSDVDPTIAQDIRYAVSDNFTGARVPGYVAAECLLTTDAAQALAKVQDDLKARQLGLKIWDCYRPAKAVKRFVHWAENGGGFDAEHHPRVARNRLIAEGYIGGRSGHSAGGTVDLTFVGPDGEALDMGTGFDFFDPLAHTTSPDISPEAKANRKILVTAMARRGFINYRREWWHFSYRSQPFAGRMLDFDILPKAP